MKLDDINNSKELGYFELPFNISNTWSLCIVVGETTAFFQGIARIMLIIFSYGRSAHLREKCDYKFHEFRALS